MTAAARAPSPGEGVLLIEERSFGARSPARLSLPPLLLLAAATVFAYLPLAGNGFTLFDGGKYIVENPHVSAGLTRDGFVWAFTSLGFAGNWHPLTWLSHMLDVELFGLEPGGHHLMNLFLHAASAALLYGFLQSLTGNRWRSLLVAILFGVHPLHVESVAWEMERKDVLSTLLGVVTLWAYLSSVRRPRPWRRALVAAVYALGLLAKPMLVTLPFVLLLLDFWPMGRACFARRGPFPPGRSHAALLLEKTPLFILAAAFSVVTLVAQRRGGLVEQMAAAEHLLTRLGNAGVSCCRYLLKTLWPTELSVHYPYVIWPWWLATAAVLLLLVVSLAVVLQARKRPHLLVGWFWYLGTLVPVLGIVQVGTQAMADRYTYLPHIGLFIIAAEALGAFAGSREWRRVGVTAAVVPIVAALMLLTRVQVGHWKDALTLFAHGVSVTRDNWLLLNASGSALLAEGRVDEAIANLRQALLLRPDYVEAHNNLGLALEQQGKTDEALSHFDQALSIKPDSAFARNNLGIVLFNHGRVDDAIAQYREILRFEPTFLPARNNLGNALVIKGEYGEALDQFTQVLRVWPDQEDVIFNYARALTVTGSWEAAAAAYARLLRLNPRSAEAHLNLGLIQRTLGRDREALTSFDEALRVRPGNAIARFNRGLLLEDAGRREEAAAEYAEALRADPQLEAARERLEDIAKPAGGGSGRQPF